MTRKCWVARPISLSSLFNSYLREADFFKKNFFAFRWFSLCNLNSLSFSSFFPFSILQLSLSQTSHVSLSGEWIYLFIFYDKLKSSLKIVEYIHFFCGSTLYFLHSSTYSEYILGNVQVITQVSFSAGVAFIYWEL